MMTKKISEQIEQLKKDLIAFHKDSTVAEILESSALNIDSLRRLGVEL